MMAVVIRVLTASVFGLFGGGLCLLALQVFPGFALALQDVEMPTVTACVAGGVVGWFLVAGPTGVPSPLRGAAAGAVAALIADPLAVAFVSLAADKTQTEPLSAEGFLALSAVGLVETAPVSLPVAVLTGAFYALLLGLLLRDRLKGR